MTSDLDLFQAAAAERETRDVVLAGHECTKKELLTKLRAAALDVWNATGHAVSANDVRHLLPPEQREGDLRFLGKLFNRDWQRVGTTITACEGATPARVGKSRGAIGTYIPVNVAAKADERRSA